MRSIDPASSGSVIGSGAVEHLRRGLSAALMVVVQATFVASALLLAPIAVVPAGAAATSASLDQCANGGKGGPRLACLLSQWQNGNINGNNSQYAEGDSVPFRALITVPNAGTHNIWIQFDNTKASKHAYDYLTSWNTTESGSPTSGTSVSASSPSSLAITTPSNVFCGSGFVGGPGVVAGSFTLYGGGTLTGMTYTTVAGGSGVPSSCTGDQSVTVKVTFTTSAGGDFILAWGGHIATQQNWGPGTSAINISGSPYHQRILQVDTTSIGNQDRSLKASAVLVPPVITSQVSHATAGQSGSISLGETITDTATVTGSAGTPAGTVDFYVCGPGLTTAVDATGCPAATTHVPAQKTLNSSGEATSDAYQPATAGFYCFRVVYTSAANSQYLNGTHTNHVTECFNVLGAALVLAKTADDSDVDAGDTIGYVLTLTNTGAGTAHGVKVTDTVPTNTGLVWAIDAAGTTGTWDLTGGILSFGGTTGVDLAASASVHVHITSPTTSGTCPTVNNSASASSTNDGSPTVGPVPITVNCSTLVLAKTADDSDVDAGDTIGYVLTLTNTGAGTAHGVKVTDTVPTNTGLVWAIDAAGTTGTWDLTGGILSFGGTTGVDLAASASVHVHITSPTTSGTCPTVNNSASASSTNDGSPTVGPVPITVNCSTLVLAKTADDSDVDAGDTIGYVLTLTNTGAGTAHGVKVTDTVPTNTGLVWAIDAAGTTGTWDLTGGILSFGGTTGVDLAASASVHVHITSPTTSGTCPTVNNSASASSTNDGSPTVGPVPITVNCSTLVLAKTADDSDVDAGDTIGYVLTLTNTGAGTAHGVKVTDTVPTNTGLVWAIDAAGTTGTWDLTGGILSFGGTTGVDLAASASVHVHITSPTTSGTCPTVNNSASASSTNDGSPTVGPVPITVNCSTLVLAKTADDSDVDAGDTIGYVLTLTNTGAGTAHGVKVTDTVPTNTGLVWAIDAAGTTGTWDLTGGILSFGGTTGVDLAASASVHVHITSPTTSGTCPTVNNSASASSTNDGSPTVGPVPITVNCPNLTLTKTADASPVNLGATIGFSITLSNGGPGDATGVTVHDPLPGGAGANWSIASQSSVPIGAFNCVISGSAPTQVVDCGATGSETDPFTLASGDSISYHVTSGTSSATACTTATLTNKVTVTGTNIAVSPLERTDTITVNCPNLTLTKTADASPVNLGATIGFSITLSNGGPGDATGVTVHDPLPGGAGANWSIASQSSVPIGAFNCVISGSAPTQVVDCGATGSETDPFTLASGDSISYHVTSGTSSATACTTATLTNKVTVTGTNIAVSPLERTDTITVNCPNLTLTKTADASPVNLGATIGFSITLSNGGPGDATGVTVHDPLPGGAGANWSIASQSSVPIGAFNCVISGSAPTQVVDCGATGSETDPFTLASGDSISYHVTSGTSSATACTTATLTNKVTVTGTNIAVSPLERTASITVNCPNTGLIAPTQTTCQQYASHTALPEPPLSYGVKNGKINNVAPGVIFYFTTITVTANNTTVVVSNVSNLAGFPPIGIQNSQAYVFTTGCAQVKTMTVSGGTATTTLNPGTYIIQIKYSPGSLVGTSVPNPSPTVTYTFSTKLNNVADGPSTATIQLIPK